MLWCIVQAGLLNADPPTETGHLPKATFRGSGGMMLQGEFAFPSEKGRRPAILLLPGSGPTDRNGNQLPMFKTDLLLELSNYFQSKGFVTFRFDKRAASSVENRQQWPTNQAEFADFFAFDRFEADVMAAYRTLRFHPKVRPNQVMVLGHSEGGLLALSTRKRLAPYALILLGTPGRSFGELLIEQIDQAMVRQRVPEPAATQIKENNRKVIEALRTGKDMPSEIHPALRSLYSPSVAKYLKQTIALDPATLPTSPGETFIVNGASDVQVHPDRDAKRLASMIQPSELVIIPSASHNFKRVVDPEKETGFTGPVMPELFTALDRWLAKHTL